MSNPYIDNGLMQLLSSGQMGPNIGQKIDENKRRELAERERLQQNEMVRRQQQANLRGSQLGNTKAALDMARKPQNQFVTKQGPDGNQYQVEVGPNGQMVGQPKMVGGMGQKKPNSPFDAISNDAKRYLPPEAITNRDSFTHQQQVQMATQAVGKARANPQGNPLDEINLQLKQADLSKKQAEVAEVETKTNKANQLKGKVVELAKTLRNHKGLDRSVGSMQGSAVGQALTLNEDSQDFNNKYNQIKSILTAENLDMMTGVLSETDIKILSDIAGGGLQLRGSEDAFKAELDTLIGAESTNNQGVRQVTTEDEWAALPSGTIYTDPDDGKKYRKP
jgi:hypothetical protein